MKISKQKFVKTKETKNHMQKNLKPTIIHKKNNKMQLISEFS